MQALGDCGAVRGRVWALVANCLFYFSINQTDQMLVHLQSFDTVPEHFTIPESTKNGVPLFYIPPGSTTPVCSLFLPLNVGKVVLPACSVLHQGMLSPSRQSGSSVALRLHLLFFVLLSNRVQMQCSACEHPIS